MAADELPQLLSSLPSRVSGEEGSTGYVSRKGTDLKKSDSILIQDNRFELSGAPEKTADALGRCYRVLQKDALQPYAEDELESSLNGNESNISLCGSAKSQSVISIAHEAHDRAPPLPRKRFSFDTTLKQRSQVHLQSADLFENFSPVQKERQLWEPTLPDAFSMGPVELIPVEASELKQRDGDLLKQLHPRTFGSPCLEARLSKEVVQAEHRPLRVGLVLSGGPAPGGHNVISGVFDYVRQIHSQSQLFGFLGGLDGLFQRKYRLINDDLMNRFRNQGGFDMLWSGRGRVNGRPDLEKAKTVCIELELQGLIIVGGDGSNSNAAVLSEYFSDHLPSCCVIGVPKTIDGDLRNPWIETSFGFDTAAKTYSELIGNLCTDITTAQQIYHFVRVMGRSASHLVMECALQTRPNLVFIGEEIEAKNITLQAVVNEIAELIIERKNRNKIFGIILVPEGLIEFIPEIKVLINELNTLMTNRDTNASDPTRSEVGSLLSADSRNVWDFLPESIQDQLLMDREASGYIQVAKIATERLLKLLTENELNKRGIDDDDLICMTHYFGYEGRCAMPSNFDSNYCYSLGHAAACLIDNKKNGYISTVRYLDQHVSMWQPAGVPFTRIMEVKTAVDGSTFPAVTRQLVDLNGPLFRTLCEVRDVWKFEDCYRCPGPIQFEGPVADIADYTVALPTKEDLLWGEHDRLIGLGRSICPKRLGALSELQKHRLRYKPDIPEICRDSYARAVSSSQYLPKDPFTQRQILLYYPHTCNSNHFHLQEIVSDRITPPVGSGLRIGVVFLSRQAPGVVNVLWGIHERLKIVGGKCIGFYGTYGLIEGKHLEIQDSDLELYLNQGGMEVLGRAQVHSLLLQDNQEKARQTCEQLLLDGLVIVGSSLAMTEAALVAEYFMAMGCRTSIIGIPATGSNNLIHDLIEANIGFDTSSKLYASLIGNVLTDAASMPKYWHFVRLMGRQPSNEVLECALQTHPNVVIIAEEYGAANKTLWDVVNDIADVICKRAEMGKNFGSVLIPDGLLSHLPNMKSLMDELSAIIRSAVQKSELKLLQKQLDSIEEYNPLNVPIEKNWIERITPWSLALFKSLPKFIRRELTQVDMGEMRFTLIETELLLSQMVGKELERRKKEAKFNGKFACVCHFFGYQGRSSMPSQFDSRLAFTYGHLASICVESGLTAHCCTVRGLVGGTKDWRLAAIPFNSMLQFMASQDDMHPDLKGRPADIPVIPSAEVNLSGKAYRWMKTAVGQWQLQDRFCNPGPVQFDGEASFFYHRMLHEEQAHYFHMLRHVQLYSSILKDTCNFGIDENFLKVVFANLNSLLSLRFHPDDLMTFLQPVADVEQYEEWQRNKGQRPEVWQTAVEEIKQGTTIPAFAHRPSVIGILAGIRLKSRTQLPEAGAPRRPSFIHTSSLDESSRPQELFGRTGSIRGSALNDVGWGDQRGVEQYPISTIAPERKHCASDVS